ncbi:hypothetical protein C6361_12735 [Plantactinospora sp. BC1]|uniref:hypothetical protein n=1 Tax=Plantactinospora sp. BC1 TaxID=2108470 RepID=UPI000D15D063|nr:hypothetical protein [Plantactinospora sp. BC1]AVT30216.1 hypothetical protein C6361_12735 [Plantactinospora sp. BC1]
MSDDLVGAPPPRVLHKLPIAEPQEILVLTYTSDLPFIEDVCVERARARGARVTIVYDADHVEPGFASGRGPLADYVPVPVVCRSGGAFHPKLVVIASATDALISIGSGNATSQGWHHSAEVWTHLRIDGPTVPTLVDDLAAWLRRLPDQLWITTLGRERLHCVADLLTTRPTQPEPDEPLLLTNDRQPLADQLPLPMNPVDRLRVASPFFDPPADALSRLLHKLRPEQLDVLLTRDAQLDPGQLRRVLDRVGTVRITKPTTSRYHHGKVLEWWSGLTGTLVTGSANCTRAALLRSMADEKGNCELALLQHITESMLDAVDAEDADLDELPLRTPEAGSEPPVPGRRVLAVHALTDPERVEVTILVTAGPVPDHLVIDLAGQSRTAAHVETHEQIHTYRIEGDPGDPARTITVRGADGSPIGVGLVIDVRSALSRTRHPSPLEDRSLPDLLGDERQMQALLDALRKLAEVRPPRPDEDDSATAKRRRRARMEEDIRRAVGSALLDLALGRDRKPTPPGNGGGELKGDDAPESSDSEQLAAERKGPPLSTAAAIQALDERRRRHAREQFQRLVEQSAQWPLAAQLAAYRIVLIAVGGGLWPHPQDWTWIVQDGLVNLWCAEEEQTLAAEHAALTAVGLIALRHGTLSHKPDPDRANSIDLLLADLRKHKDWVLDATHEAIEKYAEGMTGYTLGPRFITPHIRADLVWILQRNEIDDALDRLDDVVDAVERIADGTVIVRTQKDPRRTVINVLDRLCDFPDTHIVARAAIDVHGWWDGRRRLVLASPTRAGWQAALWRNLLTGIAGYAGSRPLPTPTETALVTNPMEAWTKFGKC